MRYQLKYTIGQIIGNLKLISYQKPNWIAQCICKKEIKITSRHLYRQKSCGCTSVSNVFKNKTPNEIVYRIKYNHYKQRAKRRNIEFNLDLTLFSDLISANCSYCLNKPITPTKYKNTIIYTNGIDRINSDLDYTAENCTACCEICNRAKGTLSVEHFKQWTRRFYEISNN